MDQRNQQGVSRVAILFFVALIAAAVFVASHVIPFFYYYFEIEGLMQSQAAKASVFSDTEIRKTLMEKIRELEIPINDDDDLRINRFGGKMVIDLDYDEVLYIDLWNGKSYDLWVFHFAPHGEREL